MIESSRLSSLPGHPAIARALAAVRPCARAPDSVRSLGHAPLDRVLGGGVPAGALHEIFPGGEGHGASAMGFAVMLALRLLEEHAAILWLREEAVQRRASLHGEGLIDLGLDPARLIFGILPDARALLRAAVDALRCTEGLGAVILEVHDNPVLLDLTASRRLALAAESSGVTPLLLRLGRARPAPSAARTRWSITPIPSARLEAGAPGHPAMTAALLRQRGGAAGQSFDLEWDRECRIFRPAALPGARLPLSGGGSGARAGAAGDAGNGDWARNGDQTRSSDGAGDSGWRIAG